MTGRWWVVIDPEDGLPFEVADDKGTAEDAARDWRGVVVEVVRADDHQGAVSLADVCEFLRAATYPDPVTGAIRHVSGWQSAAVALEREFGGR
jgi:hypothetical protein